MSPARLLPSCLPRNDGITQDCKLKCNIPSLICLSHTFCCHSVKVTNGDLHRKLLVSRLLEDGEAVGPMSYAKQKRVPYDFNLASPCPAHAGHTRYLLSLQGSPHACWRTLLHCLCYTLLQKPPSQHLSPAKLQLLSTPVLSQSLLPRIRTYPSVWSVYSHADT